MLLYNTINMRLNQLSLSYMNIASFPSLVQWQAENLRHKMLSNCCRSSVLHLLFDSLQAHHWKTQNWHAGHDQLLSKSDFGQFFMGFNDLKQELYKCITLWKPIPFNKVFNLLLLFLWRVFLSTNFLLRVCVWACVWCLCVYVLINFIGEWFDVVSA